MFSGVQLAAGGMVSVKHLTVKSCYFLVGTALGIMGLYQLPDVNIDLLALAVGFVSSAIFLSVAT